MPGPLTKNFGYSFLGTIVPGILSFLFIPFIVNLFSEAAYAQYSLAVNALNVIVLFCYGWVGQSYIRFYSRFEASFYSTAKQLLAKSLWIGLPAFIAAELFFAGSVWEYVLMLVPAFFLLGNYNFFLLTCQAQQKTIWVAWSESVRASLNIGLPLILYLIFGKIYAFEILVFSLTAAHLLPLLLFAHKVRPPGQDNPGQEGKDITSKAIRQQVLQYGIPVAFFLSFSLALSVNDRYLIAKLIDYDTAGKYASLYDIINRSVTVGCAPVLMTFYPQIAKLYNQNNQTEAYKLLWRALLIELLLFAAGFMLLSFIGIWAMNILFKREVLPEELNLILLVYTGVFFWQFAMLLHKKLELRLQTKLMAAGVFIAFTVNVVANYFLLRAYGSVLYAAITTLASSLLYMLFVLIISGGEKIKHKTGSAHN